jgi:hypothetical protein
LENPFWILICRDWYLDSKNSIDGRISSAEEGREGISLWHEWRVLGSFLKLGAIIFIRLHVDH